MRRCGSSQRYGEKYSRGKHGHVGELPEHVRQEGRTGPRRRRARRPRARARPPCGKPGGRERSRARPSRRFPAGRTSRRRRHRAAADRAAAGTRRRCPRRRRRAGRARGGGRCPTASRHRGRARTPPLRSRARRGRRRPRAGAPSADGAPPSSRRRPAAPPAAAWAPSQTRCRIRGIRRLPNRRASGPGSARSVSPRGTTSSSALVPTPSQRTSSCTRSSSSWWRPGRSGATTVTGASADSPGSSGAGNGERGPSWPSSRHDRRMRGSASRPPGQRSPPVFVTSTSRPRVLAGVHAQVGLEQPHAHSGTDLTSAASSSGSGRGARRANSSGR